jgi:hypothetical protein
MNDVRSTSSLTMKRAREVLFAIVVVVGATIVITVATNERVLITFALPFAAVLIITTRLLGPRPELIAWSILTIWLGNTYLATGTTWLEVAALVVYATAAIVGGWRQPYLLAAAWLAHPLWDFVPRDLPDLLKDLPVACLLFDIPIGLYLLVSVRRGRWADARLVEQS